MEITFQPALAAGTDYTLKFESTTKVVLTLKAGKQWRKDEGLLVATEITVGGKSYPLAGGAGIRIAVVLLNPSVKAGSVLIHETQSKVVALDGSGFTNAADTKVTLKPTEPKHYKVLAVLDETIRLQLMPDLDWLPSYLSLKQDSDKKIPLQVLSIDTGAGEVKLPEPVTIGFVVADRPGVVCDDSCEFAFDGVCDDGSEPEYEGAGGGQEMYGDDWEEAEYADDEGMGAGAGKTGGKGEDDYYMADDGYKVSACVKGTDCTDCGGVDALIDAHAPLPPGSKVDPCTNTCVYARDGVCDDPRGENYCALGTDCQDCGPVGASNSTRSDDDGSRLSPYLKSRLYLITLYFLCRLVG